MAELNTGSTAGEGHAPHGGPPSERVSPTCVSATAAAAAGAAALVSPKGDAHPSGVHVALSTHRERVAGFSFSRAGTTVRQRIKQFDLNNDGVIDEDEVVTLVHELAREEHMRRVFMYFSIVSVATICVLVAVLGGMTYSFIQAAKDTNMRGDGVMVDKLTKLPVQVASYEMMVGAGGALVARGGTNASNAVTGANATQTVLKTAPYMTKQAFTSRVPIEALMELRYLYIVSPTGAELALAVWSVARLPTTASALGSVVRIRTSEGTIELDDDVITFSEEVAPVFRDAGFTTRGRRLLGVYEVLGFFSFIRDLAVFGKPPGEPQPGLPDGDMRMLLKVYEPCWMAGENRCLRDPGNPSGLKLAGTVVEDGEDWVMHYQSVVVHGNMSSTMYSYADWEGIVKWEVANLTAGTMVTWMSSHRALDGTITTADNATAYYCTTRDVPATRTAALNPVTAGVAFKWIGVETIDGRALRHFQLTYTSEGLPNVTATFVIDYWDTHNGSVPYRYTATAKDVKLPNGQSVDLRSRTDFISVERLNNSGTPPLNDTEIASLFRLPDEAKCITNPSPFTGMRWAADAFTPPGPTWSPPTGWTAQMPGGNGSTNGRRRALTEEDGSPRPLWARIHDAHAHEFDSRTGRLLAAPATPGSGHTGITGSSLSRALSMLGMGGGSIGSSGGGAGDGTVVSMTGGAAGGTGRQLTQVTNFWASCASLLPPLSIKLGQNCAFDIHFVSGGHAGEGWKYSVWCNSQGELIPFVRFGGSLGAEYCPQGVMPGMPWFNAQGCLSVGLTPAWDGTSASIFGSVGVTGTVCVGVDNTYGTYLTGKPSINVALAKGEVDFKMYILPFCGGTTQSCVWIENALVNVYFGIGLANVDVWFRFFTKSFIKQREWLQGSEALTGPLPAWKDQSPSACWSYVDRPVYPLTDCPPGYYRRGALCYTPCPWDTWSPSDVDLYCYHSCNGCPDSVFGEASLCFCWFNWYKRPLAYRDIKPLICGPGLTQIGGLCYPDCPTGYEPLFSVATRCIQKNACPAKEYPKYCNDVYTLATGPYCVRDGADCIPSTEYFRC